jgi:uncharacterized membrane protein
MMTPEQFYQLQQRTEHSLALLFAAVVASVVSCLAIWRQLPQLQLRVSTRVNTIWIIAAIGLLYRLLKINEPLWYDELFTARLASVDLDRLFTAVSSDVHPPLWYLIQHVSASVFGNSEIALRLPALLFGVGCIVLVYRVAQLQLGERPALFAALLVAVMPGMIQYSAEARMYSALTYFVLYAVLAMLTDRPATFSLAMLATVLLHNLGAVYFGLLAVVYLIRHHQRKHIIALMPPALALAVWMPKMVSQSQDIADGFWMAPINMGSVIAPLVYLTATARIHDVLIVPIFAAVITVTTISILYSWNRYRTYAGLVIVSVMLLVPLVLALVSLLWHNVYLHRALLPAAALLPLIWLSANRFQWIKVVALAALLLSSISYLSRETKHDIGSVLQQDCHDAASVYSTSTAAAFFAAYYLPDAEQYLWYDGDDLNQTLSPFAKIALGFMPTRVDALPRPRCLISFVTPLSRPEEQVYIRGAAYPTSGVQYNFTETLRLQIYRID